MTERTTGPTVWIDVQAVDATPIYELDLTVRALNRLMTEGIDTVEKLCQETWVDLLDMRGFGQRSLQDVISELKKRGLALKGEDHAD